MEPLRSCDLRLERLQHFGRVLAFAHEHDAGDDVVVLVLPDDAFDRQHCPA